MRKASGSPASVSANDFSSLTTNLELSAVEIRFWADRVFSLRRGSGASRGERPAQWGAPQSVSKLPAAFGAPLLSPLVMVRELSPHGSREWKCPALPAP